MKLIEVTKSISVDTDAQITDTIIEKATKRLQDYMFDDDIGTIILDGFGGAGCEVGDVWWKDCMIKDVSPRLKNQVKSNNEVTKWP